MKKSINIRLVKEDDGNFYFKYRDSEIARTTSSLATLIDEGIKEGEISKGIKVVDNDYVRYIFNYQNSNELSTVQEPIKIVIRIRKEYLKEISETLKNLDMLCMKTRYIKSKNLVKILAASLAGVALLSLVGAKIADRIRDPKHYDFGRNGEYSSMDEHEQSESENEILKAYDDVSKNPYRK